MTRSVVIDDAAGLSRELVDERQKAGQVGRVAVDERAVLVEPEQPIRGDDMAIVPKDFDACIAGRLQQVEELDASLRRPTRRFVVNI